jgi:hypothetical protein
VALTGIPHYIKTNGGAVHMINFIESIFFLKKGLFSFVQLTGWPHEAVHCTSNNKFSWKGALIKTQ